MVYDSTEGMDELMKKDAEKWGKPIKDEPTMYEVWEVFEDGKQFFLYNNADRFACEVWAVNNVEFTSALKSGKSKIEIREW